MLSLLSLGPDFNLFRSRIFSLKTQGTIFRVKAVTIRFFDIWVIPHSTHSVARHVLWWSPCVDLESFVRAINLESFVTDINGPSSARQRNALKWRFAGGPMMLRIQTSIVKKPYTFVLFQRGGPDHLSPLRPKIKRLSWFWLTGPMREICLRGLSFGVSDHVRLESNCSERRTAKSSIQLYFPRERITKALIRLRRCADRSAPLLFACN